MNVFPFTRKGRAGSPEASMAGAGMLATAEVGREADAEDEV